MRLKKKTATIISFAIGAIMFTTTAMAQVLTKSGYDQLKDSVKYTAEDCTTKLSSYTMDMSVILKDNGKVIKSTSDLNKVDVKNGAKESISTSVDGKAKSENYSYTDKKSTIYKNSEQNIYYETEFTSPKENVASSNPFREDGAEDMEKIADALVGNLKDAVVVTENSDGTKTLSGTLSESQIPALVNAVVSFQSKSMFGNRYNPSKESTMPKITKDVFVKEIKGNMVTTKDGFVQSVLGTGAISGKDESGIEHKLTFELLVKLTDINSTKVSKLDLSGKKVEKNIEQNYNKLSNPEKYIGKYKTDILIEKEDKFEKIGEQFIDITAIDNKGVSGRYYEEYAKGYEEYEANKKDFKFDTKFEKDQQFNAPIIVDGSSNRGNISINPGSADIYFNSGENLGQNIKSSDQFSKVFK